MRAKSSLQFAGKLHPGALALFVLLVISLTGCGGSSTAAPPVVSAALVSIAVTPASQSLPVNGTQQFTATGAYNDGTPSQYYRASDMVFRHRGCCYCERCRPGYRNSQWKRQHSGDPEWNNRVKHFNGHSDSGFNHGDGCRFGDSRQYHNSAHRDWHTQRRQRSGPYAVSDLDVARRVRLN